MDSVIRRLYQLLRSSVGAGVIAALVLVLVVTIGTIGPSLVSHATTAPGSSESASPVEPAPLPDRGVRIGAPQNIPLPSNVQALVEYQMDGNTLAATAQLTDGSFSLLLIDLATGSAQTVFSGLANYPSVSGDYVVWMGAGGEPLSIYVFDRTTAGTRIIRRGRVGAPVLKNSLLVWQDWDEQASAPVLRSYDLAAGQSLTYTWPERASMDTAFFRLCSREWLIYLEFNTYPTASQAERAELHAYSLATQQDILVGDIFFPSGPGRGQQHACDGTRVAWMPLLKEGSQIVLEQHLFDLTTRTDRALPMPRPTGGWPTVLLSGDTLVNGTGYALDRGIGFTIRGTGAIPASLTRGGSGMQLSGDRVVWTGCPDCGGSGGSYLYTARVMRDPR